MALYSEPAFTTWVESLDEDSDPFEKHLAQTYSDYTLAFHADFVQARGNSALGIDGRGHGVCIFATADGNSGGLCAIRDDDEGHYFYNLTPEDFFEAWGTGVFEDLYNLPRS